MTHQVAFQINLLAEQTILAPYITNISRLSNLEMCALPPIPTLHELDDDIPLGDETRHQNAEKQQSLRG